MAKKENNKSEEIIKSNVELKLSLNDYEEGRASDFQKEVLKDEMDSFVPVAEGNINVSGVYAYDMGEYTEVKVFIRNATNRAIKLDKVPFMILDSTKDDVIAYQEFNLKGMGTIPAHAARPWKLNFDKKNIAGGKIPKDNWKIGFDNRLKFSDVVTIEYEKLPEDIDEDDRLQFEDFLQKLPQIEKGQFSLSKFSMGMKANGEFWAALVARNASDEVKTITKLPISVTDNKGAVMLSANFDVPDFSVNIGKARILYLIYDTKKEVGEDIDLSNWNIEYK